MNFQNFLPCLTWCKSYTSRYLVSDLVAAAVVAIMLVPQSLAYALLAGLPPQVGLYSSILPLVAYAIFGTSRTLSVGPVAVVSLMTAAALGKVSVSGSSDYAAAAITLAALSGVILLVFGFLRLGFLANFLSQPVIAGFITASALLIAAGQLKHLFGVNAKGDNLIEVAESLLPKLSDVNAITLVIGVVTLALLFWIRKRLQPTLFNLGLPKFGAEIVSRIGPILILIATMFLTWWFDIASFGVNLIGEVPSGLPQFALPTFSWELAQSLALPALLISVVGFVESVSVGQTLASKRRQYINPNQELIGLGTANLASSFSGGFPVTGGFARSIVNFDAGAQTPAAGIFAAIGLCFVTLYLTPLLHYLPQATLGATIVVAVLSLVDFSILRRSWNYAKSDFAAVSVTMLLTLFVGVEAGIVAGVGLSILMHLYKTSKPHIAILGRIPGSQHFRNIKRHAVETDSEILSMRIDESLYFANARFLEDQVNSHVARQPTIKHLILNCPAINDIDFSALESLESINSRLKSAGIAFHLSEVKGPVMDKLSKSGFLPHLTGKVYLSHHDAIADLSKLGQAR